MKIKKSMSLLALCPLVLCAQEVEIVEIVDSAIGDEAPAEVSNLVSAEVTIEATSEDITTVEVVESVEVTEVIDDSVSEEIVESELEVPVLEEVITAIPTGTEVVLELPGQATGAGASFGDEETITVDFPDEDVRTILNNVAELFDLNLVIPDGLQGRTSLKLRNVTWRDVFEVVLEPLAYTYVEDRNIIRVKTIAELTTEPVDTRVFVVNYAAAAELQASVAPLIDAGAGGQIKVDVRSNALVITERPSRMNKIQEIIERLDSETDQVMIESKFIEVRNTDTKNLGIEWSSLSEFAVAANGVTSPLKNLDTALDSAVFSAEQFDAVLSALNTKNDVEIVSNPTVVTLNNTAAKIAVGDRYPLPVYSFNSETGARQLDGFEYEDIGITLDVTPQVNSAGFINLDIVPEVSSTSANAELEGTQIPIITSRRTESNITIKDGYTLAIGGLISSTETKNSTRVPFLGNLPGLKNVFGNDSDTLIKSNLIIFITAKTLNPDGSTYKDVIDPRTIEEMGILPSDLPGYQIPEEEMKAMQDVEDFRAKTEYQQEIDALRAQLLALELAQQEKEKAEAEEAEGVRLKPKQKVK